MSNKPIYFWREYGAGHPFLSQWHTSHFHGADPKITFVMAEQYMMYHKALLFKDELIADKILRTEVPREQKELGRSVRGFDHKIWEANRDRIVEEASYYKFTNGKDKLKERFLATTPRELIEASPYDRIWGIGFSEKDADPNDREHWGLNLLGKALMRARDRIWKEQGKKLKGGEQIVEEESSPCPNGENVLADPLVKKGTEAREGD